MEDTQKKTVVVILEGDLSSIEYEGCDSIEVYKVTNLFQYESYVKSVIAKRLAHVSVVIQFTTIESLTKVMYFLNQFDGNRQTQKAKFIKQLEKFARELQPETTGDKVSVTLAQGQCELPLSFPVTILFDSNQIKDNELSPATIFNLQLARYIALKHGGDIIAASNIGSIITAKNIPTILNLEIPPKPIFSVGNDTIVIYIPQAWDSWNKIILQGKSIVSSNNDDVIRQESNLAQLNMHYDDFFHGNTSNLSGVFAHLHNSTTKPSTTEPQDPPKQVISISEFLQEIVQPSIVE
ncbi:uncharacterized protein SPAPADRAFT_48197 [Spathaspora passalidarum NRRL Y-27907]|uniref:Uncharacterized protein n=1 Tax=Spathaspora passalidarum (strain NRRL Y-27907 / 11-Y1) TaxID=619300 RepID=G3AG23_SPAPN|nr:uncharacterized protein SPAPADRAFT_48197 [Spathaspora passalidarum NRRL Y-27907]EGW35162.1 hypothetical protein SPAPADRAFT_48197 [Spathaspora passalidarum NRRL Y-27907]